MRNGVRRDWSTGDFGFNLIGFASGNLGLGVALRNTAAILEKAGYPFCIVDVDPGGNRAGHDLTWAHRFHRSLEPLPYVVNLFHLNPPEAKVLLTAHPRLFGMDSRFNACVPFWELPRFPAAWLDLMKSMDLVLAPSHFIREALAQQLPGVPCRHYPQGLVPFPAASPDRKRWDLPAGKTVFFCSFEMASDPIRKNPVSVLDAFRRAFNSRDDAMLLVKVNNRGMNERTEAATKRLRTLADGIPNVRLLEDTLAYADVLSLHASADAYVSLHRAEGLGLGLMEAMALGKPAIATDWSGNMDFMDDGNSCLVGHGFARVGPDSAYHGICEGEAPSWAEPNIDQASRWMVRLADDGALRERLGARARESLRKRSEEAARGEAFAGVAALVEHRRACGVRFSGAAPGPHAAPAVLVQNRGDASLLPGGDTIVVEEILRCARKLGANMEQSLEHEPSLRGRDVVQLTNITRTKDTLAQLRNARRQGKPTVLLSLYEDMDRYLRKAVSLDLAYYTLAKQGTVVDVEALHQLARTVPPDYDPLDNDAVRDLGIGDPARQGEILAGVDHIVTSGKGETESLRSRFAFTAPVTEVHFGINPDFRKADPGPFRAKYGLKDFVLCVGRVEARKNQWSLIEIFRKLPHLKLVLMGYFELPNAEAIFRKYAPPNVIFMGRLSREELASAYAAARVHVLPSWYELPGLVSMEAAAAGCRIVSTSWGTAPDCFGDRVRYCEPDRPATIRQAVLEAYDSAPDPGLRDYAVETFDWSKTAARFREIHERLAARASIRERLPA